VKEDAIRQDLLKVIDVLKASLVNIPLSAVMYIWRPGQLPIGQTAKARSGYRVQSLRVGRDRQCRTHPKHAVFSELVKIALPFFTAVGLTKGGAVSNAKMTSLRMMALCKSREVQFSEARLERRAHGAPM
jgi:hypothetical protein